MEYEIKKLYFGDIKKVAQTFSELDLSASDVKKLYEAFTGIFAQTNFSNIEEADIFLKEHVGKEVYKEKYMNKKPEERLQIATAFKLEKTNITDLVIEQGVFLINLVANKFEVIVDFMDYFITNVTRQQIKQFDGQDTKKALVGIFTNAGFIRYFKSMFN